MTGPWKISIRTKILLVLSGVVILSVALYLYLASKIFYEDKTLLIYELNQTNVQTLGSDVATYFKGIVDKTRTIAVLSSGTRQDLARVLPVVTRDGGSFVRIGILSRTPSGIQDIPLGTWANPLKIYDKDASYLDEVAKRFPVPFDRVLQEGTWVRNVTRSGEQSPPMMTIATPFKDTAGNTKVAYAEVMLQPLARIFANQGIAKAYLVDSEGYALVTSGGRTAVNDLRKADPLVSAAAQTKMRSEVRRFTEDDQSYLGSFYKVGVGNTLVASSVASSEAFTAARLLVRKSLLYALIVITAAFLVALFLSHSLTEPIQRLVEATRRIAQGDFDLRVPISSRDELALLASSFNTMTVDLRVSHEQIREYSKTLEKKVADRTAKLEAQTIAIRETQEALVRTTRLASVGEVAGRAAHEVLNPLTNITARLEKIRNQDLKGDRQDLALLMEIVEAWSKSFREGGASALMIALNAPSSAHPGKTLLEEDLDNLLAIAKDTTAHHDHRQSDLDFLLKECARISKIVNGMRQLTRVSGSRKRVQVHELLNEALSSMGDLFAKNGIRVERNYCDASPCILGDHDELLQVLNNLCRNSMQAIQELQREKPGHAGEIRLSTVLDGNAGRVQIRVSDNGPGILPQNFNQIFEPSFTTKGIEEGTGLGLSIARRFIRAHEGEITLERSIPGTETVFLIELPETSEAQHGT